jgi:hypothetical protein
MEERIYKKYFIGRAKPGEWSSVYAYKPHNHEILVKRGEIFAVISLTGPESFAVSTAGNLILDNLHEMYFENKEDTPLISLEKAVKGASSYLQKLLENDSAADVGIDFDLITMTILGDLIYFVSLGGNVAKIWRDGRVTDVAQLLKDPTGEGLIQVGSMVAGSGDIYFLSSEQFEKEAQEDTYIDLAETFSDLPLKQRLYEKESRISLIMVGYNLDFDNLQKSAIQEVSSDSEPEEVVSEQPVDDSDELVEADDATEVEEEQQPKRERFDEMGDLPEKELPEDDQFVDNDDDFLSEDEEAEETTQERFESRSLVNNRNQPLLSKIGTFLTTIKSRIPLPKQGTRKSVAVNVNDKPTFFYYLSKAGSKLKGMLGVVWEDWLGMGRGSKNLRGANRNKRWGFLLILAVVIGGMIYFSVQDSLRVQKQKNLELEAQKYLTQATQELDKLEGDARIIAKSNLNTERKDVFMKQLTASEDVLDKARGVDKLAADVKKVDERIQKIEDLINKTISITNVDQIVDMGAKNPGANLSDIAIGNKQIFFSDEKYGKIYSVGYDGKNEVELATGLSSPTSISYDPNGNLIFIDKTSDRKIGAINVYDKTIQRIAGTSESKLGGVTQIEFAVLDSKAKQYRLYAIDPVNKAVYHLESRDSLSFGLPVKRAITLPELASVRDISITDLKIYLSLPYNQGFFRAYGDKNDTPQIAGLASTDNLKDSSAFFVDDQYMYIADSSTQSIYVITKDNPPEIKDMQFRAKYTYRGSESYFKNIKDIVADRAAGKIFVLDGSRVFVLSMSELSNF